MTTTRERNISVSQLEEILIYLVNKRQRKISKKMKDTIVLYPSPGIGHLISIVELGKLIRNHHPSFSVTILITTPPFNTGSTAPYINHVSQTTPSIIFHHLPTLTLSSLHTIPSAHHESIIFELLRLNNPLVHQTLQTISITSTIRSFVLDFFCATVLNVTSLLNIPSYFFYTSGAGSLVPFLHIPTCHKNSTKSFKDLNTHLDFPGLPPIHTSDMPLPALDRNDPAYENLIFLSSSSRKAKGIIVNTFESLEKRAIKAIRDGLCVTDASTPPLYCIGPLVADRGGDSASSTHECLTWLDSQPSQSVVFLCFGSYGLFSAAQLREIAIGLERSGKRFLWVVRSAPLEDKGGSVLAPLDPDLDLLLPEGFLDRTRERGLVVNNWAPQVDVLNRESVGGFVTHCGWNSVLEAVCAGVPMVAWPLYAEQRLNRVLLVEEMKLALSMEESEDRFVSAEEVEKRVGMLIDSEDGRALRERTQLAKDKALAALREGGSSRVALDELVESWASL